MAQIPTSLYSGGTGIMGSYHWRHCWSGFGQGAPGNLQKGWQQPVDCGSQALEAAAALRQARPLSQLLACL